MVRFLTDSFPTAYDRFVHEVDWEPQYPTYREGLESIIETWLEDGRLVVTDDGYAWSDTVPTRCRCRIVGGTLRRTHA